MIAPNKRSPAANGAGNANYPRASYGAFLRPTIADWLNPRRRMKCEKLLYYIGWHGSKIYLDAAGYADIRAAEELDPYQVDAAIDDLYTLGCIDVARWGENVILTLLDRDIDRLSGPGKAVAR